MKSRKLMSIITMTLLAALAISGPLAAQEQHERKKGLRHYTVVDLGPAGPFSNGVNNRGWVAGTELLPDGITQRAFLWREGVKRGLGTLGGPNSNVFSGPSGKGQVIGQTETSTSDPLGEDFCTNGTHLICLPFIWQIGVMIPLPTLGGNNGAAYSINNRSELVGSAENTLSDPTCQPPQLLQAKPVIWERGEIQELPTVSGDPDGVALRINDNGQAVGASANCAIPFHALLWQRNRRDESLGHSDAVDNGDHQEVEFWTATDLGNLGGAMNNVAEGINERGQVVGFSDLSGDTLTHAFLWENGVMTDLGTLPGGDISSLAFAINDEGQVVGFSCGTNFGCGAFLWNDGVMTDLNTLLPAGTPLFLTQAYDINSRGEIVGLGDPGNHTFLAIPCDDDHPNIEGCDYDPVDPSTATARTLAPLFKSSTTTAAPQRSLTPRENVAAWRARLARQYHFPVTGTPKN